MVVLLVVVTVVVVAVVLVIEVVVEVLVIYCQLVWFLTFQPVVSFEVDEDNNDADEDPSQRQYTRDGEGASSGTNTLSLRKRFVRDSYIIHTYIHMNIYIHSHTVTSHSYIQISTYLLQ